MTPYSVIARSEIPRPDKSGLRMTEGKELNERCRGVKPRCNRGFLHKFEAKGPMSGK